MAIWITCTMKNGKKLATWTFYFFAKIPILFLKCTPSKTVRHQTIWNLFFYINSLWSLHFKKPRIPAHIPTILAKKTSILWQNSMPTMESTSRPANHDFKETNHWFHRQVLFSRKFYENLGLFKNSPIFQKRVKYVIYLSIYWAC